VAFGDTPALVEPPRPFSTQLIDRWIAYKRDKEITPLRMRPHPLEFSMYFDI